MTNTQLTRFKEYAKVHDHLVAKWLVESFEEIDRLRGELAARDAVIAQLRDVCAQAYQLAGAIGAPLKALDTLHAGADGEAIPSESFLPVRDTDCTEVQRRDAVIQAAEEALEGIRELTGYPVIAMLCADALSQIAALRKAQ